MQLINNTIIEYLDENHHGWTALCIESTNCVCIYQIGTDPTSENIEKWMAMDFEEGRVYMGGHSEIFGYDNIFQVITRLIGVRESIIDNALCDADE